MTIGEVMGKNVDINFERTHDYPLQRVKSQRGADKGKIRGAAKISAQVNPLKTFSYQS